MGYVRDDSAAALAAMNAVYADLRLLHNLFLPSVKLQRKERVGARLRRYYDAPQTPLDRVRACPHADPLKVAASGPRSIRLCSPPESIKSSRASTPWPITDGP